MTAIAVTSILRRKLQLNACTSTFGMISTCRFMSSTQRPLLGTSQVNVGRLAGAMTGRIRSGDPCIVDAIGPEACNKVVRSFMLASEYIQDTHKGKQLAFELQRVIAPARGSNPETVKLRFHSTLVDQFPLPDRPDLVTARDTNPGVLAGELQNLLLQRGDSGIVVIGGLGARAISMCLKTMQMAHKYMQKHLKQDEALLAVCSSQQIPVKDSEETRWRFVLSCARGPAANPHYEEDAIDDVE
eukprot:TRINITY_DN4704_c0_g1_i1.p1 TRINITY_DN4704_c0_g1~~TRINITY_DN4704_c0_g1_i1.p1  ORF type:complete len:263 (+),score=31.02 TRINITY_DN4704_c0_g1_i1:62-790(+)